jgi:6-phosphogluconolactonase
MELFIACVALLMAYLVHSWNYSLLNFLPVGSLYPNRDEIKEIEAWVIGVEMKNPPSISLTLPVMLRAKQAVVSAAGKSDKYPQGKAVAMRLAIEDTNITPAEFPACALREKAIWILDEPNASAMPNLKRTSFDEVVV